MRYWIPLFLLGLLTTPLSANLGTPTVVPLERCSELPITPGETMLGVATPATDPSLAIRFYELSFFYPTLSVCERPWNQILPRFAPWAQVEGLGVWHGWVVFGVALILALLLSQLLPRRWRRQATLLGLLGLAGGTWGLAVAGLDLLNRSGLPQHFLLGNRIVIQRYMGPEEWLPVEGIRDLDRALIVRGLQGHEAVPGVAVTTAELRAEPGGAALPLYQDTPMETTGRQTLVGQEHYVEVHKVATLGASDPEPPLTAWALVSSLQLRFTSTGEDPVGRIFRVHHPLNIRSGPGVQHPTLGRVLARNSRVKVVGPVQGDWWQVQAGDRTGWVSSLWLRAVTVRSGPEK